MGITWWGFLRSRELELAVPIFSMAFLWQGSQMSPRKKTRGPLLSMKYWLFYRDPYFMVYYNFHTTGQLGSMIPYMHHCSDPRIPWELKWDAPAGGAPLKFNRSPLKNGSWKMILSYWEGKLLGGMLNFRGVSTGILLPVSINLTESTIASWIWKSQDLNQT